MKQQNGKKKIIILLNYSHKHLHHKVKVEYNGIIDKHWKTKVINIILKN